MKEQSLARLTPVAQPNMGALSEPGPSLPGDTEVDLLQLLGMLWRSKWWIVFYAFAALFLGGYYTFEVAVPKYTAQASLAVQARDQQVVDLESVISGVSTEDAAINTELEVIRSRGLLEQLVTEMNLVADPEFNGYLQPPSALSRRGIRSLLAQYLPISPPEAVPEPDPDTLRIRVTDAVRNVLTVSAQRNTYLINIAATTTSSVKSAEIVNTLAQLYLNDQIAVKFSATEFAVDWLSDRVTELELELKEKEDAIKNLRADTELVSVEALEALNVRSKNLRERVSEAQTAAVLAQDRLQRLTDLADRRDVDAIVAEVIDPQLNRLETGARAGNERALQAFFTRFEDLVAQERLNVDRAGSQLLTLRTSYDQLLETIEVQNADLVQLNQLAREADATRVLYGTFLTRLKETSVQIGLQRADSRILSRATPGWLVAPRKNRILAVSFILGGLLGVGIILLRQMLHDGVRTGEQLEQLTGYPVLGQIPKLPIKRRQGLLGYLESKPTSAAAEAIRNLRTSILMSKIDEPPQVIMSTSSVPGEGKTTNAISLAHNFSGLGKKILLIEGDIRRRTLGQYFQQTPPGSLIKVVSGEQLLSDAVIHDDTLNIDVLMGDKSPINAADLFSSQKFHEFISLARASYDVVIIDTPPVLVVPDARVIGHMVDTILYTVNWNRTGKQQVVNGLRQFSSVGLRVSGLILSQIDSKGMKRYGYGGKYGAYGSYGHGYYDLS